MPDSHGGFLLDALEQVIPLVKKYDMEVEDWTPLVAELAVGKGAVSNPFEFIKRHAPYGPTLLTGGLPDRSPDYNQRERELEGDHDLEVHSELERALSEYQEQKHDAESLKKLLETMVIVIRAHRYHTSPDDGGLRQKKIGAFVEAALAYSRKQGRPSRNQERINQILTAWEELVRESDATWNRCPRQKIVQRLARSGITLSEDQVRAAMSSRNGKAAKKNRLSGRT